MGAFHSRVQTTELSDNPKYDYQYYKSPSLNVHISYDLLTRILERTYELESSHKDVQLPNKNLQNEQSNVSSNEELSISSDLLEELVEERAHEKFEQMMAKSRIARELPLKTKEAYTSHQLHAEADELLRQEWYEKPVLSMRDSHSNTCTKERTDLFNCMRSHKATPLTCRHLVESFDRCIHKYTITSSNHL